MDVTAVLNRLKKAYGAGNMNDLAYKMGVSKKTFNSWRNRKNIPKEHILSCFMNTGYPVEWIVGDDSHKNTNIIVEDNNVQIQGKGNSVKQTKGSDEMDEIFLLMKQYATPKLLQEIKTKLLKIKEAIDG